MFEDCRPTFAKLDCMLKRTDSFFNAAAALFDLRSKRIRHWPVRSNDGEFINLLQSIAELGIVARFRRSDQLPGHEIASPPGAEWAGAAQCLLPPGDGFTVTTLNRYFARPPQNLHIPWTLFGLGGKKLLGQFQIAL